MKKEKKRESKSKKDEENKIKERDGLGRGCWVHVKERKTWGICGERKEDKKNTIFCVLIILKN
jgi:hypothetical protein